MADPSLGSDPDRAPEPFVRQHRGQFAVGDLVQLTDPKGRHHTITLVAGQQFHSHKGAIEHDAILGSPEGIVVTSTGGIGYLCLRPLLRDFVLSMPRGATVVYPKDAASIVGLLDLHPGHRVLEAGAGSGALTCSLLRAVGDAGRVVSYERRADFAAVAATNVRRWFGREHPAWELIVGDLATGTSDSGAALPPGQPAQFDAVVLDMLAPWDCVETVAHSLAPGGVLVGYVATTTQLSRLVETLRADGRWTEPRSEETLLRTWHLEGLAVRPDHRMSGHTGFLMSTRRLADGTVLPARRTRPAKGAYGDDYTGPGAAGPATVEPGGPTD